MIYAQPVALKPVGHPIAAVPVKGPHHGPHGHGPRPEFAGPYGPPRPVPFPSKYGPPPHGIRPPRPGPGYGGPKPFPLYEKPSFDGPSGPGSFEVDGPTGSGYLSSNDKIHSSDKSTVVVNAQGNELISNNIT